MSNLHQPYFSTKGLELPEFKYNIFRSRKACFISVVGWCFSQQTSATRKGGTKGEMRRDKASQDPHHEASVPIKRAIRPVLRQPSQASTNPCPPDSVSPLDPREAAVCLLHSTTHCLQRNNHKSSRNSQPFTSTLYPKLSPCQDKYPIP